MANNESLWVHKKYSHGKFLKLTDWVWISPKEYLGFFWHAVCFVLFNIKKTNLGIIVVTEPSVNRVNFASAITSSFGRVCTVGVRKGVLGKIRSVPQPNSWNKYIKNNYNNNNDKLTHTAKNLRKQHKNQKLNTIYWGNGLDIWLD